MRRVHVLVLAQADTADRRRVTTRDYCGQRVDRLIIAIKHFVIIAIKQFVR